MAAVDLFKIELLRCAILVCVSAKGLKSLSEMTAYTNTLDLLADVCSTVGISEALVNMKSSDAQWAAFPSHESTVVIYDCGSSPLFIADGVEYFHVEAILGHARRGKSIRFLVKWMGFSDAHNTWEPRKSLAHLEVFKAYKSTHMCLGR